jgi:hypothetical protein
MGDEKGNGKGERGETESGGEGDSGGGGGNVRRIVEAAVHQSTVLVRSVGVSCGHIFLDIRLFLTNNKLSP